MMMHASALAYDFMADGLYYTLNGNEVSVSRSPSNSYSGDIVISSSVTYNGTTYAATGLDYRAFLYCPVTSVVIPDSVTEIGNWAFMHCYALSDVYSEIVNPATIDMGTDVFSDYNDGANFTGRTLHVPSGILEAYQADTKWSEFFESIVESGLKGDADGDGEVSIGDVSLLIDHLVGNIAANINQDNADLDGDGKVTIADVSGLIDLLLTQ